MSISTVKLGGVVTEYVAAVNAFDEDGIVATFATRRAEADGHPRVPHPLYDARPRAGRLRLLTPASPWAMNDSFTNDAKIALRIGAATVGLHPADAAERGLAEGDLAALTNDTGAKRAAQTLTPSTPASTPTWAAAPPSTESRSPSHRHVIHHARPLRRCQTFTECSPSDYPVAPRGF